VREFYPWIAEQLGVTHPNINTLNYDRIIPGAPTTAKPNVVLVICESFSAYKSSMIGNPLNTTPYFNQMVQNGIYFDHCFSPAYGTARGVWATVTGVPDVQLFKTASRNPAAVDQHTIINDFKGYEKYYFLGGSTSWANIRGLLTNNIDSLHLYEEGDYKAAKIDVWGISDKNLFLEANKVLGKQQKPFFAVIQTGIKGVAGNMLPKVFSDQSLTSEHVPLLFYAPSLLKPARYTYPASQLDILPTIAGICNIGYVNTALGSDLLNQKDSAASRAFIIDIDARRIGIIKSGLYYSYNLSGGGEQLSSISNDDKVVMTDSLQRAYRKATDAYYETARYLLLNNKKRKNQKD